MTIHLSQSPGLLFPPNLVPKGFATNLSNPLGRMVTSLGEICLERDAAKTGEHQHLPVEPVVTLTIEVIDLITEGRKDRIFG